MLVTQMDPSRPFTFGTDHALAHLRDGFTLRDRVAARSRTKTNGYSLKK